jgi:hypothetical protein
MATTTPHLSPDASTARPTDDASDADSLPGHVATASRLDEGRFRTLLRRWNRHQDLRRDGADVATLSRSREVLDAAREALRSAPYGRGA